MKQARIFKNMWGIVWGTDFRANKKRASVYSQALDFIVVAGAGFEPATFGL